MMFHIYFGKGQHTKPEDYFPRDLFVQREQDGINPYRFKYQKPKRYANAEKWTKIAVVRNPFERLYSAWKDKSRTFRFQNGTVDWEKAARETTWSWAELS